MKHAIPHTGPVLVLGLGDAAKGDEGIGVAALMRLREEWHFSPVVDLVDATTWDDSLMKMIEAASGVLIVTALDSGAQPGQIVELQGADLPRLFESRTAAGRMDLTLALTVAGWRGRLPARTCILGVQPGSAAAGNGLSPRLRARLDVVLFKIIRRLESWEHAAWRTAPLGLHAHA